MSVQTDPTDVERAALGSLNAERAALVSLTRCIAQDGSAKRLRVQAQLSLGDMSRALGGVPATTIMRWERGEHLPSADLAVRYGALLAALAENEGGDEAA
jgi:DNA-binding XRE family transcriptional regulator